MAGTMRPRKAGAQSSDQRARQAKTLPRLALEPILQDLGGTMEHRGDP